MVLKNGMLKVLNSEKHLDHAKYPVPFEGRPYNSKFYADGTPKIPGVRKDGTPRMKGIGKRRHY